MLGSSFAPAACFLMFVKNWVNPSRSSGFLLLKGPAPCTLNQRGLQMLELAQEVQYELLMWNTTNSGYSLELSYKVATVIEAFTHEK